tara:strand:+ start:544 stop:747 length:204 start_codon:yes stop_codon:yes gene_type:complete
MDCSNTDFVYDYEWVCWFMCNEDWEKLWGDHPHILGLYKALEIAHKELDSLEKKLEKMNEEIDGSTE